MSKTKMGKYNPITSERFHTIKGALAEGDSDEHIKEVYKIKETTLRYIKKCQTYYEFYLRTEGIPAARKMPDVILPNCRLKLIDIPMKRTRREKRPKPVYEEEDDRIHNNILALMVAALAVITGAAIFLCVFLIKIMLS